MLGPKACKYVSQKLVKIKQTVINGVHGVLVMMHSGSELIKHENTAVTDEQPSCKVISTHCHSSVFCSDEHSHTLCAVSLWLNTKGSGDGPGRRSRYPSED